MTESRFKYIFGPVYSWRLGRSLGIDPISAENKVCNFDCIYCQLGKTTHPESTRKKFVETADIIQEIQELGPVEVDYYTFSGRGETTLAKNLGSMIRSLREMGKRKIAVITNATLMDRSDVQDDLLLADFVLAKLDGCDQDSFKKINRVVEGIRFENIVNGIKSFKRRFNGRLALQMMFVQENKDMVSEMAKIARDIYPDEIQINTPLRPCGVTPLDKNDMAKIKSYFEGLPAISVYEVEKQDWKPLSLEDTTKRHGTIEEKSTEK